MEFESPEAYLLLSIFAIRHFSVKNTNIILFRVRLDILRSRKLQERLCRALRLGQARDVFQIYKSRKLKMTQSKKHLTKI